MPRPFTGRPARLKTFDYLGFHRYFLTFCTYQRRRILVSHERVSLAFEQILRTAVEQRFGIVAYCFMPDHLHLLVEGQAPDADCRRFIARAKQRSAFYYQRVHGHRLWQHYGFERTLREGEPTSSVARYILENPVRARLVERASEYPFLGSCVYTIEEITEAVQLLDGWDRRPG